MPIETPRLLLRAFTPADAADLQEILGDAETMQHSEPAYSLEKTKEFLTDFCIGRGGAVAAVHKESNKLIGYLLFHASCEGVYEMGWFFNRRYWQQGYAYEACQAVIDHAFGQRNAHKIFAETTDGVKSVRLMLKLGMRLEGIQRSQTRESDGNWADLYCYGLLEEDWNKNHSPVAGLVETAVIALKQELSGTILDIGGGGEGIIGRLYGAQVTAIDNRQEELEEAPDGFQKVLMDATKLQYAADSFNHATFFFSLMFMEDRQQREALREAARVVKPGGELRIWDCHIPSAYPDPFCVDVEIHLPEETVRTTYGVGKLSTQSLASIAQQCTDAGLHLIEQHAETNHFYLRFRKKQANK